MLNKQVKVCLGLRTSLIFICFVVVVVVVVVVVFYCCFPRLDCFYFYVFFVLRHL